ncbi:pilus assembly protein [Lentisphaerota bacterium ZTH]|nr:pilus assembly protein [Lentisphaerota bacterium]WET05779.1 pilus assembly protein [Lentisphaerota bacterium ZTH]
MVRRQQNLFRRVLSPRGTAFLETAFVMPLLFTVLFFCVDLIRINTFKQRLVSANRLIAEVRGHNDGNYDKIVDKDKIKEWLFKDMNMCGDIRIVNPSNSGSMINSLINEVDNFLGGIFSMIVGELLNVFSGGTMNPYLLDPMRHDVFYSGRVIMKVRTILPASVYQGLGKVKFGGDYYVDTDTVYFPSLNAEKERGRSYTSIIKQFFHGLFG